MSDGLELCGAQLAKREGTCSQRAGWGTSHVGYGRCKRHGGATPNHEKAARKHEAAVEARRLGLEREVHEEPGEVLMAELRRSRALTAHWDEQFAVGAVKLRGSDGRLTVEGQLWQRERDRSIEVAKICSKLGLEERRIELEESVARDIGRVLRNAARALGMTEHPEFAAVMRRELSTMSTVTVPAPLAVIEGREVAS